MKRSIVTVLLWGITCAFITGCDKGQVETAAQVDPALRKAAVDKLQAMGKKPTLQALARELVGSCKVEVLQLYLEAGISPHATSASGATLLMLLILNGTDKEEVVKCAQLLLEHGTKVNVADRTGQTALHYAVGRNNPELVKVLIKAGADVNATDRQGLSVLERTFSSEITEILKAAGAKEKAPEPGFLF